VIKVHSLKCEKQEKKIVLRKMKKKKKKYIFVVQRIRQKKPSIKKNQELLS